MESIYDKQYKRVGFMSPDSLNGISYYDDQLTTSLETGLYFYTFKLPKSTPRTSVLEVGNYIETRTMHGKQLLLVISSVDENRVEKTIYCEDTTIKVLNSYVEGLEVPLTPQRIDYYLQPTLAGTDLELRANESTDELILDLSGEQRILERLRVIAEAFGVELDFDVEFSPGSPPKRYISFLKRRIEDYSGFRVSSDKLIRDMERSVNTLNIATKLKVKGASLGTTEINVTDNQEPVVEEPVASGLHERAIAEAFRIKALGLPYQWGGNGNPSYDCSGFVQQCFKAAGLNPASSGWPRSTTYSMWAQDGSYRRISRNELKRGDLVMYDTGYTTPGDVNHVGIYLGPTLDAPNSVIHAGNPVGKTQRANSMTIIGYVRVVE